MGSFHADAAEDAALDAISNPDCARMIHLTRESIKSGRWGDRYISIIGKPERGPWTIGQLWAAALVHGGLSAGEIVIRRIPVCATPSPDRMRKDNAEALASMPEPWKPSLDMEQANGDCDGILSWDQAVAFLQAETDDKPYGSLVRVEPKSGVPLEVGSTMPSRTWLHLFGNLAVARWPYGDDHVTVLHRLISPPKVSVALEDDDWIRGAS